MNPHQWNDFLVRSVDPYATAKYEMLLDWAGNVENKRILVVGSGDGQFAVLLALRGAKITAVDIDEKSVALTKATANRNGVEIESLVSTLEYLPQLPPFDFVVATDVIEHIENDIAAAEKLLSLTSPGGKVLITVPALQWLFGYHDEILGHYRRYKKKDLVKLFSPHTHIENCKYYGFLLIPVAWLISKVLRKPYPVAKVGKLEKNSGFVGGIIKNVFRFERRLTPPLGTSILLIASKFSADKQA